MCKRLPFLGAGAALACAALLTREPIVVERNIHDRPVQMTADGPDDGLAQSTNLLVCDWKQPGAGTVAGHPPPVRTPVDSASRRGDAPAGTDGLFGDRRMERRLRRLPRNERAASVRYAVRN